MANMMMMKSMMFLVMFNFAAATANFIGGFLFVGSPQIGTSSIVNSAISSLSGVLVTLVLTAGVLALFAFSLLIPTIPFVIAFFALSGALTATYIWQLPLPAAFLVPITAGVAIVYYLGISQYSARSTFYGT